MLQGVLFDMDGVLFDTERIFAEVERRVAKDMDREMPDELLGRMYGTTKTATEQILLDFYGPEFDVHTYLDAVSAGHRATVAREGLPLKPGVEPLLEWLKKNSWKIALASSTRLATVTRYLEQSNLRGYFDAVITGDMIEASKPAPDIFLAAANAIGLPPAACAAVEDSFNGISSASAAGCMTLMVPDQMQPTEEIRAKCAAVLPSLNEVAAFLEQYNLSHPE